MRTKSLAVCVPGILLLAPLPAGAQFFFPPYEVTFSDSFVSLAQKDQVRNELKLDEAGLAKLEAATRPVRDKYAKEIQELQKLPAPEAKEKYAKFRADVLEESAKAIEGALTPGQFKRLKQIELQQLGAKAFDDKEVRKALGLSEDQVKKVEASAAEAREDEARALKTTGLTYPLMQEIRKKHLERNLAVLTKDQHKAWQEMAGEPFTLRIGPK